METNGVYFDKDDDVSICEYSGLPAVSTYVDEEDYHVGHS